MKFETQTLIDAAAFRGELLDMAIAGVSVALCLAIVWLFVELGRT